MINSVSSVSFKANPQSAQERLSAPGKFTKPQAIENAKPQKKGGFLKGLAKLVAAVIIVGGGVLLGYKKGLFNVLPDLENAKLMEKAGHYLGKAGEWIDNKAWSKLANLFTSKKSA